jgi:SpoVK/Ycf46/Vps4 family AAA+-type ATPase
LRLTPEAIADAAQHARLRAEAAELPLGVDVVRQSARQLGGARKTLTAPTGRMGRLTDLILPPHIMAPLERFVRWAKHRDAMVESSSLFELGGKSPGLAALFTGSPGTGKTLAAHIVADELGLDLFPVDLPAVVDKYIGETEKNLERVFHQAESMNVVMFFDEADALFGRRSEVKDAHDRYANQEIAYLLQRMERFDGLTILATNLRGNIDQAFSRRMSAIVHFPDPDPATRRRLWQSHVNLAGVLDPTDPVDLSQLADAAEMAGGDIRNIVLGAAYDAAAEGSPIGMRHLRAATVAEFSKLGRRLPAAVFG